MLRTPPILTSAIEVEPDTDINPAISGSRLPHCSTGGWMCGRSKHYDNKASERSESLEKGV
jgi:hypothetical protein